MQNVQRSSEWVNILLKVLLVLMMPIHMSIYVVQEEFHTEYGCFLQIASGGSPYSLGLRAWIGLALILLPGVWFSFVIHKRPLENRVRGLAVLSVGLTLLIGYLVSHASSPIWLLPGSYVDISVVHQVQSPSLALLIVLPLLLREARILSVSEDQLAMSPLEIDDKPPRTLSRNRLLTILLWFSLVFCPLFGSYLTQPEYGLAIWRLDGLFYNYHALLYSSGYWMTGQELVIFVNALDFPSLIGAMALLSSLRLVFLRYVFMYLRGRITKTRLVFVGALGEILPGLAVGILATVAPYAEMTMLGFPFPLFPLAAFVFVRLAEPHVRSDEIEQGVSEDYEDIELRTDSPGLADTITVPVIYVLKSKMIGIARRIRNRAGAS